MLGAMRSSVRSRVWMADLLLARARGLEGFERHVVIKRIRADAENDQAFIDMFLIEARLAAALHHHNIVQVYDIGEENGKPYFAMEYVHGEDLRRLLTEVVRKREQVPVPMAVTIVTAVARALHHAQSSGALISNRSASCTATCHQRTSSSATTGT